MFDFFYQPKSFCREYVELRKSSIQLIQFMATVLGLKRSYDDWFPLSSAEKIKSLCKTYKLHYKFDWIFLPQKDVSRVISGGARLPTTQMKGMPFSHKVKDTDEASVHVFLSRKKRDAELSFRNGWYPLIIKNRAVHKPQIDHVRFGYFLGYPDCCVDFFRRYNNHFRYNYLFEVLKNTRTIPMTACNPLLKNSTFSYIYHMPCSYDCARTMEYVRQLKKELLPIEPELIRRSEEMLARPFLVLGEQSLYIFEGKLRDKEIIYEDFAFIGSCVPESARLDSALRQGNKIKITDNTVSILREEEKILDICNLFPPFVIKFEEEQ